MMHYENAENISIHLFYNRMFCAAALLIIHFDI